MAKGHKVAKAPDKVANKWQQNLGSARQAIMDGVQGVTTAPGQLAAQRADAYLAGIQDAVNSKRWQNNVAAVTLQDWQSAMLDKGLANIARGAQKGNEHYRNFYANFAPVLNQLQSQLSSTPRGGLEANIARMTAAVRFLHQWKGKLGKKGHGGPGAIF